MTDTDTRVNWREIDSTTEAGRRALDVEIARRLGYTVRHSRQTNTYALVRPSGYLHMANVALNSPSVANWTFKDVSDLFERHLEHEAWLDCEYYTSDLNAAASLPIDDIYHWEIRVYLEGITNAGIIPNAFFDVKEHREDADTEALARCKAWLAWHEATDESEDEG